MRSIPRASTPVAIDLFCGLGGWTDGLLAEGYDVTGYDIEAHAYADMRYPARLVILDVLALHGSQLNHADLIVASPPCQFFSYTAMPWKKAKARAAVTRADPVRFEKEIALFSACFRIQREACAAAGRHIPLVVENVRGAEPWIGRARWNFGSYYLWGDVPALMPAAVNAMKVPSFRPFRRTDVGNGARFTSRDCGVERVNGRKQGGDWFAEARQGGAGGTLASFGSKSPARKAASAMIAKIPLPLARHIAAVYLPVTVDIGAANCSRQFSVYSCPSTG